MVFNLFCVSKPLCLSLEASSHSEMLRWSVQVSEMLRWSVQVSVLAWAGCSHMSQAGILPWRSSHPPWLWRRGRCELIWVCLLVCLFVCCVTSRVWVQPCRHSPAPSGAAATRGWIFSSLRNQSCSPGAALLPAPSPDRESLQGTLHRGFGVKTKVMPTVTDPFCPNLGETHKENVTGEKESGR